MTLLPCDYSERESRLSDWGQILGNTIDNISMFEFERHDTPRAVTICGILKYLTQQLQNHVAFEKELEEIDRFLTDCKTEQQRRNPTSETTPEEIELEIQGLDCFRT